MARPLRLEHPGAISHVTTPGNERRAIARSDADRRAFVDLLGESITLHRWILHAWVLMTNHYHLLVETPLPTLSRSQRRFVRPAFEAVTDAVARRFGESAGAIQVRSHGAARKALAHLASEESGLTFVAIGAWLGITGAAAAYLARQSRELEKSDRIYQALLVGIRADLAAAPGAEKRSMR